MIGEGGESLRLGFEGERLTGEGHHVNDPGPKALINHMSDTPVGRGGGWDGGRGQNLISHSSHSSL